MTDQEVAVSLQLKLEQFLSSVVELTGEIGWLSGTDSLELALEDAKVVVETIEQLLDLKRKSA